MPSLASCCRNAQRDIFLLEGYHGDFKFTRSFCKLRPYTILEVLMNYHVHHYCTHTKINCRKYPFYHAILIWSSCWHKFEINFFEIINTVFFNVVFTCVVTVNYFDIFLYNIQLPQERGEFSVNCYFYLWRSIIIACCISLGVKYNYWRLHDLNSFVR